MRRDAPRRLDDEGDDARALDEERVVVVAAHFCDVALARVVIERAVALAAAAAAAEDLEASRGLLG